MNEDKDKELIVEGRLGQFTGNRQYTVDFVVSALANLDKRL